MKSYAVASFCPSEPITPEIGSALAAQLYRVEHAWRDVPGVNDAWSGLQHVPLNYSTEIGAVPADPEAAVVVLLPDFSQFPDVDPRDEAFHSVDEQGRQVCYISLAVCGADWIVAMSHEIAESRVDAKCRTTVKGLFGHLNPDGLDEPVEVDDRLQGTDYVEPGTTISVANSATPSFFDPSGLPPYDTRVLATGESPVTHPFWQGPAAYHEQIAADGTASNVYGDEVSEAKRAYIERTGVRGGMRKRAAA